MEKAQKIKTKVRFTSLDVAAMVSNLQMLIGMRATNIYDLNPSTYLIKIAKSQQKHYLLIQNGVRFHTTNEKPDKKTIPSGFTMKFRKFLRSKRLESIRQVGVERVVVFTFGSQAFTNHLIIELYSQGNIILTDNNYRILQCIRSHEFNDKVKTAVGQIYPFEYAANIYLENIDVSVNKIDQFLEKQEKGEGETKDQEGDNKKKKDKKAKNKGGMKLKDLVFKLIPCLFPLVIEHILLANKKNPDEKVSRQNKQTITQGAKICFKFLKEYLTSKHLGYLFEKQDKPKQVPLKQGEAKQRDYFQFSSYKNIKFSQQKCSEFSTFNQAVEEYFAHYKKTQHQQEEQFEQIAWKKYGQIKKDQDERVKKLQEQQDIYKLKAEYIEKNIADIDAIIKIIKTMQDNGYSWDDIGRMIAESKKNGDPLANMIHELNILKRQVIILLGDPIDQQQMFELLPVQINIDYNAYTNATIYYESKKKNYQKEQRTKQASQQVLKLAEKDALKKIEKKKNEVLAKNMPQRKVFWFQKFNWFVSSQGYLIISGRDSHQNQLVVKRYMKPGDLYMHSDYGGAASTVIKRNRKDIPVPHATLEQAAIFTVCRSKAWDTKILSGAWWVYHDQVSKSAPTGEFLPTGSFMIRGKRNFIQPNRMQMGMTLLFKVDNQSAQRHMNDRRIHEEELKKQEENKRPQITLSTKEDQEFAIVSVDTQTRKQRAEQIKQQKKDLNMKKQASKTQILNEELKGKQNKKSDNSGSDEQQDSEQEIQAPKNLAKKLSQSNKNIKGTNKETKKEQSQQSKQKHQQRNKKKLKKLEKYLQEQDEDERQIIMKMLGAKQMKHMKQVQSQQEEVNKGVNNQNKKKKKDKKNVKKGINKYIDMESDDEEMKEKLNPDKVLFLQDKKKQQEEDKKLMENSSESEDQEKKDNKQANSEENKQEEEITNQQTEIQQQGQEEEEEEKEEEIKEEEVKPEDDEQVDEKVLDSELGELYKLVGQPHSEDKFDCLVAMCAPYNSIKQNKFKIKLVPGGLKKGKASRSILSYFTSGEISQEDKILLRSIAQQEVINAVIGNVKLAGAGLLKMQMKEKQDKKQKRKQEDNKKKETAE